MTSTDDPIFRGCIPALMTPCNADRAPDYDNLIETGKKLMDVGMRAMVYCGSMGDWPLLTDEQRQEGVRRLVEAEVPLADHRRAVAGALELLAEKYFVEGHAAGLRGVDHGVLHARANTKTARHERRARRRARRRRVEAVQDHAVLRQ